MSSTYVFYDSPELNVSRRLELPASMVKMIDRLIDWNARIEARQAVRSLPDYLALDMGLNQMVHGNGLGDFPQR